MKNIIAISLSVGIGLASIASYADRYNLGTVQIKQGSSKSMSLSPLKKKFIYDVTCSIVNHGDTEAAIRVNQRYNDFSTVILDGESLHKINARETVQGRLNPNISIMVINDLNNNSGVLMKDYLTFSRSSSSSKAEIDIACSAEASHNPSFMGS